VKSRLLLLGGLLVLGGLLGSGTSRAQPAPIPYDEENEPTPEPPSATPAPTEPRPLPPLGPPPPPVATAPVPPPPPPPAANTAIPPPTRPPPAALRRFFVGLGMAVGFFSPSSVNTYIEDRTHQLGTVIVLDGFSGMFVNVVPRFTATFVPIRFLELSAVGEVAWGPKSLSVTNGGSELFSFMRYALGFEAIGCFPLHRHGDGPFLGAGFTYNWMHFENFAASAPGLRLMGGYRILSGKLSLQPFAAFDWIRGGAGTPISSAHPQEMYLNYTGFLVGFNIHLGIY
jgi:hypothetical protein